MRIAVLGRAAAAGHGAAAVPGCERPPDRAVGVALLTPEEEHGPAGVEHEALVAAAAPVPLEHVDGHHRAVGELEQRVRVAATGAERLLVDVDHHRTGRPTALTERQRHDAYEALHQAFGDHTDTVIELLRPDHDHLATREDLAHVRAEVADLRTQLETEMAQLRAELET